MYNNHWKHQNHHHTGTSTTSTTSTTRRRASASTPQAGTSNPTNRVSTRTHNTTIKTRGTTRATGSMTNSSLRSTTTREDDTYATACAITCSTPTNPTNPTNANVNNTPHNTSSTYVGHPSKTEEENHSQYLFRPILTSMNSTPTSTSSTNKKHATFMSAVAAAAAAATTKTEDDACPTPTRTYTSTCSISSSTASSFRSSPICLGVSTSSTFVSSSNQPNTRLSLHSSTSTPIRMMTMKTTPTSSTVAAFSDTNDEDSNNEQDMDILSPLYSDEQNYGWSTPLSFSSLPPTSFHNQKYGITTTTTTTTSSRPTSLTPASFSSSPCSLSSSSTTKSPLLSSPPVSGFSSLGLLSTITGHIGANGASSCSDNSSTAAEVSSPKLPFCKNEVNNNINSNIINIISGKSQEQDIYFDSVSTTCMMESYNNLHDGGTMIEIHAPMAKRSATSSTTIASNDVMIGGNDIDCDSRRFMMTTNQHRSVSISSSGSNLSSLSSSTSAKSKKFAIRPKFTPLNVHQEAYTSSFKPMVSTSTGVSGSGKKSITSGSNSNAPSSAIGASKKSSFVNYTASSSTSTSGNTNTNRSLSDGASNRVVTSSPRARGVGSGTTTPTAQPQYMGITANTANLNLSPSLCIPVLPTSTTSPSPSPTSSSSRLSPKSPKSGGGLSKKGNLIKTEFCKFILNGQKCKFGSLCNFAHNEEELNYKTLFERHDAGLLDKETLRTRPCFDFVATGSCPFDSRCASIHDPRIEAKDEKHQFWLPHCSLETKNLNTDLHIDWFRNYSFMETHYGHGLGQDFGLISNAMLTGSKNYMDKSRTDDDSSEGSVPVMNSFDKFYNKVVHRLDAMDLDDSLQDSISNQQHDQPSNSFVKKKALLTEAQRIEIELKMRTLKKNGGGRSTSSISLEKDHAFTSSTALYKYKPSHIVFNEMCMILQSRAFDISPTETTDDSMTTRINCLENTSQGGDFKTVREIELDDYDPDNENNLLVYDIAFGLAGSSNDGINSGHMTTNENNRMRALWFHIKKEDVRECTLQERMNYKKTSRKLEKLKTIQDSKAADAFAAAHAENSNDCYHSHNRSNYLTALKSFDIEDEIYQNGLIEKPIIMNLPMDKDLFDLTTEVLKHRLSVTTKESNRYGTEKFVRDEELFRIEKKFQSLKAHLTEICFWPINEGREIVDEHTPVPKVDGFYSVPVQCMKDELLSFEEEFYFHSNAWKSFTITAEMNFEQSSSYNKESSSLAVFKKLATSSNDWKTTNVNTAFCDVTSSGEDVNLPHIKDYFGGIKKVNKDHSLIDMEDKFWSNLILGKGFGDWDMIKSFYSSRN